MNFPAQARTQAVPGRCALIVDADPQVTSALGSVFEPEQWAILHAPDNREALKLAEARAFDLIITGAKSTGKEDIDLLRKSMSSFPVDFAPVMMRSKALASANFNASRLSGACRIAHCSGSNTLPSALVTCGSASTISAHLPGTACVRACAGKFINLVFEWPYSTAANYMYAP